MTEAGIKSVIVSDTDARPIGIPTSTDFVKMAADGNTPAESSIGEYMTSDIVTVTPYTPVDEAADAIVEHDISRCRSFAAMVA